MQSATSNADQTASFMKLADYSGGSVMATYQVLEHSGYHSDRPGLKKLLRDIKTGAVGMAVCEALDRLARDAEYVGSLARN